jgi:hypothetical protein
MSEAADPVLKLVLDKGKHVIVDYLQTIPVSIGIENPHPTAAMAVESLTLRFQSRGPLPAGVDSDPNTTIIHPDAVLAIPPRTLGYLTVQVRPNLLFQRSTNYYYVVVGYRLNTDKIGKLEFWTGEGGFVIIKSAPQMFGKTFISYKEPEDRALAELLFEFAKDAGFRPYLAPADISTGSRIWGKKIPSEIKTSKFMFVIWTAHAPLGPGVEKEIRIAGRNKIEIVPFVERSAPRPRLISKDVELAVFDATSAAITFAQVVAARRKL